MIKMSIKTTGEPLEKTRLRVQSVNLKSVDVMTEFGIDAAEKMRSFIKPTRSGSTGNLASNITAEVNVTEDGIGVGIGNIERLNKFAKYWYVIDKGVTGKTGTKWIPPSRKGSFDGDPRRPEAGKSGFRWHNRSNGKYFINPQRAIYEGKPPMNYVEKTNNWINRNFKKRISKLLG